MTQTFIDNIFPRFAKTFDAEVKKRLESTENAATAPREVGGEQMPAETSDGPGFV